MPLLWSGVSIESSVISVNSVSRLCGGATSSSDGVVVVAKYCLCGPHWPSGSCTLQVQSLPLLLGWNVCFLWRGMFVHEERILGTLSLLFSISLQRKRGVWHILVSGTSYTIKRTKSITSLLVCKEKSCFYFHFSLLFGKVSITFSIRSTWKWLVHYM